MDQQQVSLGTVFEASMFAGGSSSHHLYNEMVRGRHGVFVKGRVAFLWLYEANVCGNWSARLKRLGFFVYLSCILTSRMIGQMVHITATMKGLTLQRWPDSA